LKKFICAFLFSFYCFGVAQAQMSEELEYLEQLQEAFEQNTETRIAPEVTAFRHEKEKKEQPSFQAVLRKGSQVYRLNGEKTWTVDRPLYVKTRLQFPGSPQSLLLNKKGEAILATRTENISSLQDVTEIYPTTDPTKRYVDSTAFRSVNKGYDLETKLSVHVETSDATYLSRFHNSDETNATSSRLQMENYFLSILPVDFGLTLSYQYGNFGNEGSRQLTIFDGIYFGPAVKAQIYQNDDSSLEIFGKVEKSLRLQSEDTSTLNKFSSNAWSIGVDWTKQTLLGRFFVGIAYRVQRYSLKETSNPDLEIPSEKQSLTGPSILLGYRFTINL